MFGLGPTPFDIHLVAFRIPIRVHPTFWLGMLLFGWNPDHPEIMFIWVVCGFFSILIHELGHALTAETFGWPTQILLYFGGGLAMSARYHNNSLGRSIAVSIMGPGAGFLFLVVIMIVEQVLDINQLLINDYRFYAFAFLKFMNLWWGLLNLLPILPLDGGQICASVCQVLRLRDGIGTATKISVAISGAAAYYFYYHLHQELGAMLMLMLCLQNIGSLQSRK